MVNPSLNKGNRYEWDLITAATPLLEPAGLEIERTKAGSERDLGDLHIRVRGDRSTLAAVQAKNRRERKWAEWTDDAMIQATRAGARFGALFVKRVRVASVLASYAIMPVGEWLHLLAALHTAERERNAAVASVVRLTESIEYLNARVLDGDRQPVPDPDALAEPPGTVRGRQVYPAPDMPADIPAGRLDGWTLLRDDMCDRCVPGAHGERIDVSLPGQLPCAHVS